MQRLVILVLVLAMTIGLAMTASVAAVPRLINYQGVLTDAAGVAIEGSHNLTFKVYADSVASSAMWTEVHTGVVLSRGMFSVILGGVTALTDGLFVDPSLWLGITMDAQSETAPRMRLTSVPWAMRSAIADSARVAGGTSSGESLWQAVGGDVYRLSGNVGIGTSAPQEELHVKSASTAAATLLLQRGDNPTTNYTYLADLGSTSAALRKTAATGAPYIDVDAIAGDGVSNATLRFFRSTNTTGVKRLQFFRGNNSTSVDAQIGIDGQPSYFQKYGGNFGIGTSAPADRLHVDGGAVFDSTLTLNLAATGAYGSGTYVNLSSGWTISRTGGPYGINQLNIKNTASSPTTGTLINLGPKVVVSGETWTDVLRIRGGADIAEPFVVSKTGDDKCDPGTVVVIDHVMPGCLRQSDEAYDTRVAGVVSGAGDLPVGISMGEGSGLGGDTPVAMTGRVYVKCTAENGPIKPGDRLTTSGVPGFAMKATDNLRAPGAVIGKAMSALDSGTGLVLVLVNLQ